MTNNEYTVDMVNGEVKVIVNKSGKAYGADLAPGFTAFIADKDASIDSAKDMFKTIFPNKGDYAKFESNQRPMFVPDSVKVEVPVAKTSAPVTADVKPNRNGTKVITVLRDALPIIRKNAGGRYCLPSVKVTNELGYTFKCACCGMVVTNAAVEYMLNNQDLFETNKKVVLCNADQENTKANRPTLTSKERTATRRDAYLKAQYATVEYMLNNNVQVETQGF